VQSNPARFGTGPRRRLSAPMPKPPQNPYSMASFSQFRLKNSQFRYAGNFADKSLELLTD
jgi:hypothetical protein